MKIKNIVSSIFFFFVFLPSAKTQSFSIGYGQASTRSSAPIPLVDGPSKSDFPGNNFYFITGSYPWKRWDLGGAFTTYNAGVSIGIDDADWAALATNDMRIQRYEAFIAFNIIKREKRLILAPLINFGVQNSFNFRRNDFNFLKVNTPNYSEIFKSVEFHPNVQLEGSLGLQAGVRLGKSRRLSININTSYLYAPKKIETIHFYYYRLPNRTDTLYAKSDGRTTGFYKSISLGYTIPFKKKNKAAVNPSEIFFEGSKNQIIE